MNKTMDVVTPVVHSNEEANDFLVIINGDNDSQRTSDKIYNFILKSIYNGEYHPGSRIKESQLSKKFGYSNIAVREAMARLVYEGWVVRIFNKGIFFKNTSFEELRELHGIRLMCELRAVRQLAEEINAHQLQQLDGLVEVLKSEDSSFPFYYHKTIMQDIKFHSMLIHLTGNKTLEKITIPVICKDMILDRFFMPSDSLVAKLVCDHLEKISLHGATSIAHQEIYAALAAHNVKLSEQLIKEHFVLRQKWRDAVEDLIKTDEGYISLKDRPMSRFKNYQDKKKGETL